MINRTQFIAIVSACLFLLAVVLSLPSIDEWIASLWLVDYPNEFVKRGLIGTVLSLLPGDYFLSISYINVLATCAFYLLLICFGLFVFKSYAENPLLLSLLLVSSFSIQQFAYDIGRFDQVNIVLAFFVLWLINSSSQVLGLLMAMLMSSLMLLIHEASALINIPVILTAFLFKARLQHRSLSIPGIYLAFCVFIFIVVVFFGRLDTISQSSWELSFMLSKNTDFTFDGNALSFMGNSLADNIAMSVDRLFSLQGVKRIFRVLLVSIAIVYIIRRLYLSCYKHLGADALLLLLPSFSILPLFFLGIDFYRWIALIFFNFFVALGFLLNLLPTEKVKDILTLSKTALILAIVLALYAGPLGVSVALPERLFLIKAFY